MHGAVDVQIQMFGLRDKLYVVKAIVSKQQLGM